MGSGEEISTPVQSISIPMRYAVLLRDLRLSVPVFDDKFNPDEFSTIFGALKGLQVRMMKFEHNLDKIELGMNKLEHRIDSMEQHMDELHNLMDPESPPEQQDPQQQEQQELHYCIEDCPRDNIIPQECEPREKPELLIKELPMTT